jgi:hypothetical protein
MQMMNPMQMMMNMGQPRQQTPAINQQQFTSAMQNVSKEDLVNMVNVARQQGISEADIEAGLNFILKMR